MPGLARKSGWNAVRTEPFDFSLPYTSCAVCRYSGATKGTFIQQGGSASATRAGAGAGPRPGQAHISARRGRPRPKTGRARAGRRGADQPAQTAGARCRRRPCPRPHPGPACSLLVHAHCSHVCSASPSADDPRVHAVQRHWRPEQLLATSCKEKSRIRIELTIENLSD